MEGERDWLRVARKSGMRCRDAGRQGGVIRHRAGVFPGKGDGTFLEKREGQKHWGEWANRGV